MHDESNSLMVDLEERYVDHLTEEHRRSTITGHHNFHGDNEHRLDEKAEESERMRQSMLKGDSSGFEFEDTGHAQQVVESIHQKLAARISKAAPTDYNKDALLNAVLMAEAREKQQEGGAFDS